MQGPTYAPEAAEVIDGFSAFQITRDDQLCSGHDAHACVTPGTVAYEDAEGWIYCRAAARVAADEALDQPGTGEDQPNDYKRWSATPGGWDAYTDEDAPAGRDWLTMDRGEFDTQAPPVQLAMFAAPDALGTPDLFGGES